MAKKESVDLGNELKKLLASGKLVIGTEETIKALKAGKVNKVFLASNCESDAKSDIERLCKLGNLECVMLTQQNEEIGTLCKKPFAISVVGVSA